MSEIALDDEVTRLEEELDKAQIILAFVLQEIGGSISIPKSKPLEDGIAVAVDEEEDSLVVRLVGA